jgi:alpha-glucosidase
VTARRWWEGAVGYEVYLPSFADADGDGYGDLAGLRGRLEHLAWLGVDIVWVSPFYPSPMRDHGYDVSDYTDVHPRFGTLGDFDALLAKAHDLGLRLIIDLVPNHTSSEHRWFREARSSRDSPYRDYYIWRDPGPDGGPPNNWVSHFGGPAWTYDEATGQYWLHLFLPDQPDLNWRNPAVAEEFDDILRFWFERGVDGFRIDVAHALVKHPELPDLPPAPPSGSKEAPLVDESPTIEHGRLAHIYDVDQPEVLDVYRRWRKLAEAYDALLLGEVYLLQAKRLDPYLRDGDGLHLAFWFALLHGGWDVDALRRALAEGAALAPGSVAWVQACHDRPRPPTRFGGGQVGRARSLALATLLAGLPGTPFLYQGEELALPDGELRQEDAQDPVALHTGDVREGRDGCRTPMPWAPGPGMGFSAARRPWLPFGGRTDDDTVAGQRDDPQSWLQRYRRLLQVLRDRPDLAHGEFAWLTDQGPVIAYRRGAAVVAANGGNDDASLPLPAGLWTVAFGTAVAREGGQASGTLELAAAEGVVLVPRA